MHAHFDSLQSLTSSQAADTEVVVQLHTFSESTLQSWHRTAVFVKLG